MNQITMYKHNNSFHQLCKTVTLSSSVKCRSHVVSIQFHCNTCFIENQMILWTKHKKPFYNLLFCGFVIKYKELFLLYQENVYSCELHFSIFCLSSKYYFKYQFVLALLSFNKASILLVVSRCINAW